MNEERTFLNSKEVAQILDLSPDDIYVLVHRGELKATKVGRFWRYRPEDVEAYVEEVKTLEYLFLRNA
jgi:excisionase family DNA binding protein